MLILYDFGWDVCLGVGLLIRVTIRSLRGLFGGRFNGVPTE